MPPQLAALICILLIVYLFWIDRKNNEGVSHAIWVPFFWVFFSRSRNISEWLNLRSPDISASADVLLEGNPLNSAVYTILIVLGLIILKQRKIDWQSIFTKNSWVWLYFVFGAVSFIWSDYPFVSFKRWFKASGTLIMALVVLTEIRPYITIGVILKRLAFILIPLSVLFIIYYPALGRAYHMGQPMYTGVGDSKNSLGSLCMLAGIYFSWNLLLGRRDENQTGQRLHFSIYVIILPMIIWLFYMANSATSLTSTVFALCLFMLARLPVFSREPRKIMIIGIVSVVVFGIMELTFGLKDTIITMLGRRPDFTDRTYLWDSYLSLVINPIFGYGFEMFYTSVLKQGKIKEFVPAHNGYLEMYLNLGIIGILFVVGWIVSGLIKVWRYLLIDYSAAILRLAFIVVIALYSWTEVTFVGVNSLWMLLFIGVLSVPGREGAARGWNAKEPGTIK